MGKLKRVLFLCCHNSARSQMAEAFLNHFFPDKYRAYSAGVVATSVNPYAVEVMREAGIDISSHRSKSIHEFATMQFDIVVTVCDSAREACPFFPGKRVMHHPFDDPAAAKENKMEVFRRVRDEIREWIEKFPSMP